MGMHGDQQLTHGILQMSKRKIDGWEFRMRLTRTLLQCLWGAKPHNDIHDSKSQTNDNYDIAFRLLLNMGPILHKER